MLIENDGALFRGPGRGVPQEVWSPKAKAWKPYVGQVPKPVDWGEEVGEERAAELQAAD